MSTDTFIGIWLLVLVVVGFILFSFGLFRENGSFLLYGMIFYVLGFLITASYFISIMFFS